jgi:1-pyrroline-5-carboxylate dehydrogenase
MTNALFNVTTPDNERARQYQPGSNERASLEKTLDKMLGETIDIPLIIGSQEIRTGNTEPITMPHNHKLVLGYFHKAKPEHVEQAINSALEAWKCWSVMRWEDRASIQLRAAELLAGEWRDIINASTMLGQGKNVMQAEIDAACETIDFMRFNVRFLKEIYEQQPEPGHQMWNRLEYRPLEGFVFTVSPFNFTSIASNLNLAPVLMGNVTVWKPASTAVYSAYYLMKLFEKAGMPPGVINFIPGSGPEIGKIALTHRNLAGIHFTGSTPVFQGMWKTVGENIAKYRMYPRLVGETGGKDFIFVHESADLHELATAIIRGAFEYQGQKCSAASRMYIPKNIWNELKDILIPEMKTIKMGDIRDLAVFMGAVIDRHAFNSIMGYIDYAKKSKEAEIIHGGNSDDSTGYFIEPTLIETSDPHFKLMEEEIFGPVLTMYQYDPDKYIETLEICDQTSPYALTGSIFAKDRSAIMSAYRILRNAAGNFYINDKPTGAVVGQQPFGGARASGTNDKAGSHTNLHRWISPRTIKENFLPPRDYRYPHMK